MAARAGAPAFCAIRQRSAVASDHVCAGYLVDGDGPGLTHHQLELTAEKREHGLDSLLSKRRQTPDVGPADSNRRRAERERLEDVGPASKAAVDEDRHSASDSRRDLR